MLMSKPGVFAACCDSSGAEGALKVEVGEFELVLVRASGGDGEVDAAHFPRSRVEERRGVLVAARLPSPLIKPDVPISGIRLSDWLHLATVGGGPR